MRLRGLELTGFKSFSKKTVLEFLHPIVCIVGPNGSGKSNVVEALRFVLGEQSMKSLRGSSGTDLIFKGSKHLAKSVRAVVTAHFDNSDRTFKFVGDIGESRNLNYDTISISREVYPDGLNKYILNGEEIRLKDINNLLSSINIGSSGHHIISQGEADRILSASPKDRREMIEDALGLKIYQYRIRESERKLERTEHNMQEVSLLRRENAPHLSFLKKQMEKFERAEGMKNKLADLYEEYFSREYVYLEKEKSAMVAEKSRIQEEIDSVSSKFASVEDRTSFSGSRKVEELRSGERKMEELRAQRGELERKLGRIEGRLESKENKTALAGRCPLCGSEIRDTDTGQAEKRQRDEKELLELTNARQAMVGEIAKGIALEKELSQSLESLKEAISRETESLRKLERDKFSLKVKQQELASALSLLRVRQEGLSREMFDFENEVKEAVALSGSRVLSYKEIKIDAEPSGDGERDLQRECKKKIERIKIKLEDVGPGSGTELMKEFREVNERDQFLAKEMEDLTKSIESLTDIIVDLREKVDLEFQAGIEKINTEFGNFFSLVFGGGTAHLSVVTENKRRKRGETEEEDESAFAPPKLVERRRASQNFGLAMPNGYAVASAAREENVVEQGIEIDVALPHKKVRRLDALSGGERSLTSIALLFAISQVHPPPFLVLDETDAALDESNSCKYADMLEELSLRSELILVTHNRETMSRAGILYGVTLGADGASRLLSVRLEEAAAIAK